MTRGSRTWAALSVVGLLAVRAQAVLPSQALAAQALAAPTQDFRNLLPPPPPPLAWTYPAQGYSAPHRDPRPNESDAARREVSAAIRTLKQQFSESADYTSAMNEVRDAQRAYRDACKSVLSDVHDSPAYRSKQLELSQAEEQLDRARSKSSDQKAITEAAQRCCIIRGAMRRLESDALSSDSSIAPMRQASIDASMRLRQLVKQFESGIPASREFLAARAHLDAAQGRVARGQ
jgi:hypothetical protein